MKQKFILITCLLLLIPLGIVVAQSSPNFVIQRFTPMSGGLSESPNYTVNSVIGQPLVANSESPNYTVTSGFLSVRLADSATTIWLPIIQR